jgi:hypothetical protein
VWNGLGMRKVRGGEVEKKREARKGDVCLSWVRVGEWKRKVSGIARSYIIHSTYGTLLH